MENVCDQLIQCVLAEFTKGKNRDKINSEVLDPIICYVGRKLIPYVVFSVVVISFILSIFTMVAIHYLTRVGVKFKEFKT